MATAPKRPEAGGFSPPARENVPGDVGHFGVRAGRGKQPEG
jgi:hypothetical protein